MGMIQSLKEEKLSQYDGKTLPLTMLWTCGCCGQAPYLHLEYFDDGVERRCVGYSVVCFDCGIIFFGGSRVEAARRWNDWHFALREQS